MRSVRKLLWLKRNENEAVVATCQTGSLKSGNTCHAKTHQWEGLSVDSSGYPLCVGSLAASCHPKHNKYS